VVAQLLPLTTQPTLQEDQNCCSRSRKRSGLREASNGLILVTAGHLDERTLMTPSTGPDSEILAKILDSHNLQLAVRNDTVRHSAGAYCHVCCSEMHRIGRLPDRMVKRT
jgi:hypothetical protein